MPAGVALCLLAVVRKHPLPSRRLWNQAAISTLLNVIFLYGGQIAASAYLSPGLTAGLLYLQPVLVTMFARLWLNEALSKIKLVGIFFGLAGVGLIALSVDAKASALGIMFAVAGAVGWALGTVYVKRHENDSPFWFIGLQFLMGGAAFTIVSLLIPSHPTHWTPMAISCLSLLAAQQVHGCYGLRFSAEVRQAA